MTTMHDDDIAYGVLVTITDDRHGQRYWGWAGTIVDVVRDRRCKVTRVLVRAEDDGHEKWFHRKWSGTVFRCHRDDGSRYADRLILGEHPVIGDDLPL